MQRDTLILALLQFGRLAVDFLTGTICSLKIPGHHGCPVPLPGSRCKGYVVHTLRYQGCRKQALAHRIVWMAAHGPIPLGWMLDHINRDRADNRLCNLRLVDACGNAANRVDQSGEHNPSARLTAAAVSAIRALWGQGESLRQIGRAFGICKSQVHNIVTGRQWKDAGAVA